MATSCDTVQSIRTGDGTTTQFSFTFTYDKESEVNVSLWDETIEYYVPLANDQWSFVNATTIAFNTAPPALVDNDGNPIANIKIWRQTDVDSLVASFYPGSAIRAQDLNSNFEQLRNAIQEGRCAIPDGVIVLLGDYWNRTADTIRSTTTWVSADDKIATTAAIDKQIADIDSFPEAPDDGAQYARQSKTWTEVSSSIPEAPSDNRIYGRRNKVWTEVTGGGSGGGLLYKGEIDLTGPAPNAPGAGDLYINTATTGTCDSSWTGIGGTALNGNERVAFNGTEWDILPADDKLWNTNGNDIYYNKGDVGIGTDSPSSELEVTGFIQSSQGLKFNDIDSAYGLFPLGSQTLAFNINDDEKVRITASGNVGIGTDSPGSKLVIEDNKADYSYFDHRNIDPAGGVVWRHIIQKEDNTGTTSNDIASLKGGGFTIGANDPAATNFIGFNVAGSRAQTILANGNVGIGTASPAALLDVNDSNLNTTDIRPDKSIAKFGAIGGNGIYTGFLNDGTKSYPNYIQSGYLDAAGSVQYPLALNPRGGNVGIGTDSPATKLDVNGTIRATAFDLESLPTL